MDPIGNTEMTNRSNRFFPLEDQSTNVAEATWAKTPRIFFHYTGCVIGILYTLNNQFFFIAHLKIHVGSRRSNLGKQKSKKHGNKFILPTDTPENQLGTWKWSPKCTFSSKVSSRFHLSFQVYVIPSYSYHIYHALGKWMGGSPVLASRKSMYRSGPEKALICQHNF